LKIKKIQYLILTKSIGFYINIFGLFFPKKASYIAYKIFSQPRIGKLNKLDIPAFLKTSKQEKLDYKQHKIQTYSWQGNQNKILLVHGWESNTMRWKKLFPYLKKTGSTIIAIDAPAHGLSNGNEFNAILYSEFVKVAVDKFQPNAIIGHSVGAMASFYYQYKNQNPVVQKLVLMGAPSDLRIIFANYVNLLSLNSRMKKALENYFIQKFNLELDDFSGQKFCSEIKTKGLVVHDINDKIVAYSEGEKIGNAYQNAKFITTNGFGHSLHKEDLYEKITEFLLEA
jgi:pimeloyl-ACP methyl ester carboxylesterase